MLAKNSNSKFLMLEIRVFKHFTQGVAKSKKYSDMAVSPNFW